MKTHENFQTYLDRMLSASSEKEKDKIKHEFDTFFSTLNFDEKKDFQAFQKNIAETVKREMKEIESQMINSVDA